MQIYQNSKIKLHKKHINTLLLDIHK